MKTDQHRTLFADVAHRQPRAVAVAPGWAFNRAKHVVSLHLADVPQAVFQRPLFHRDLRAQVQMLHLATTTGPGVQAEVRAAGLHALGRFPVNLSDRTLLETAFLAVHIGADHLKRQGPFHKHHFAIGAVGNALGFNV